MRIRKYDLCVIFTLIIAILADLSKAFAWGERGHDVVARVAARLVDTRLKGNELKYGTILHRKENMLGHLANVPDIVWRSGPEEVTKSNSPTHYFDIDDLVKKPVFASFPRRFEDANQVAQKQGHKLATDIGTAPWRVAQLAELMKNTLAKLPHKPNGGVNPELESIVNQALVYGGTMAHFVGDLGQPLHTTANYDGWDDGQGGIHSYFEEAIVDELPLNMDYEVFAVALREEPFKHVLTKAYKSASNFRTKIEDFVFCLALDSYSHIDDLLRIDKSLAIIKPSKTEPIKIPAERRAAITVANSFSPMIIERLAASADTLATIWIDAWKEAGSPDLNYYRSYNYQIQPAYIVSDYTPAQ